MAAATVVEPTPVAAATAGIATDPADGDSATMTSPRHTDGVLPAGIRQRIEDGEPFVVLCGSAIVEAEDGEALVYLRRGSMCRFAALSHTRWTVADDVELLPVTEAAMVFRERGGAVRRVAP